MLIKWLHNKKFEPNTVPGYIVGYTKRVSTYKVYIPKLGKVMIKCYIIIAPHKDIDRDIENLTLTKPTSDKVQSYSSNGASSQQEQNEENQPITSTPKNVADTSVSMDELLDRVNEIENKEHRTIGPDELQRQQFLLDKFFREFKEPQQYTSRNGIHCNRTAPKNRSCSHRYCTAHDYSTECIACLSIQERAQ